jgi:hypothetical protein
MWAHYKTIKESEEDGMFLRRISEIIAKQFYTKPIPETTEIDIFDDNKLFVEFFWKWKENYKM